MARAPWRQSRETRRRHRIQDGERRQLARELHDVVTHQVSTAFLHAQRLDEAEDEGLRASVAPIRQAISSALIELRLMGQVLRHDPEVGPSDLPIEELRDRVPPTRAAAEASAALERAGFTPQFTVPEACDQLEMTVQVTLARIIDEATANIIQHAARNTRCDLEVKVTPTHVTARISSALPEAAKDQPEGSRWGLAGLSERVSLTLGTFSAGQHADQWIVAASLPRE